MATLTITLTEEDKSLLQSAAAAAGKPVGKYIIGLLSYPVEVTAEDPVFEGVQEETKFEPRRSTRMTYCQDQNGVRAIIDAAINGGHRIEAVFPLTNNEYGYYVAISWPVE